MTLGSDNSSSTPVKPEIVLEDCDARPNTGVIVPAPAGWYRDRIVAFGVGQARKTYEHVGEDPDGRWIYRWQDWSRVPAKRRH